MDTKGVLETPGPANNMGHRRQEQLKVEGSAAGSGEGHRAERRDGLVLLSRRSSNKAVGTKYETWKRKACPAWGPEIK